MKIEVPICQVPQTSLGKITDYLAWVSQTWLVLTIFHIGFLVSKETVVLCWWERWKQKFGFIKQVDKGWITTVKDLESWHFER